MDSTFELLRDYIFSKLTTYGLLFSFSSLFFFSFHYLFLSKLVRPFMLSSWTFTPWSFHGVFSHITPFFLSPFFYFTGGIYWVLLGFLMNSNINWSKLSSLIKIKGFWSIVNNWNLYLSIVLGCWFCKKFTRWFFFFWLKDRGMHSLFSDFGWNIYNLW